MNLIGLNPVELAASLLGLANIALLVRRSVWNFPFALASVTCTGIVLYGARLYAETGLQAFFFAANLWGWWLWLRSKGAGDRTVTVGWMDARARLGWTFATMTLSLSLGWVLHRFTDAALPFADSAVAGASIAAQILLSLRRVENWVLWVLIDVTAVWLYLSRGLPLLAGLYAAFLIMSVLGLRQWSKAACGC
ncbi:nicotinamide riboside transporter PnuC [Novosphingobium sp. 17-62-19]|uniref:nicotinamide riboside transporter PnuC n=1 Tax=Novosphingobium sp. 17-62-19 TaxID=1970406 RepID=UPI0025E63268|nr:nicotinamide riboside transporter PnuC [Novosphingobium sp. 17-62-19]HQS98063.1 nicotinamide riboside transporter PnuC [Novosphingobium sp.]